MDSPDAPLPNVAQNPNDESDDLQAPTNVPDQDLSFLKALSVSTEDQLLQDSPEFNGYPTQEGPEERRQHALSGKKSNISSSNSNIKLEWPFYQN